MTNENNLKLEKEGKRVVIDDKKPHSSKNGLAD